MADSTPRPTEDELIARYFAPIAGAAGLALRDDAACLPTIPGRDVVLTADALVAGVHFFSNDPPDAIAWKALAVNLSDLAAKGAAPLGFLLSLALPPDWSADWLAGFAEGLGRCAQEGGCPLLGGDTVKTPGPLTLSITALGSVPAGGMVPRTGARPGDAIFVSGTIGDSMLGLQLRLGDPIWAGALAPDERAHLLERYLLPRPRLGLAAALQAHASGGMDVSDGLVGDVSKMMRASDAGLRVDLARLPLSPAAQAVVTRDPAMLLAAASGGDDYEVLASVPPEQAASFAAAAAEAGIAVTRIGDVVPAADGIRFTRGGEPVDIARGSFSHF